MLIGQLFSLAIAVAIIMVIYFHYKKNSNKAAGILMKVSSFTLAGVFFIRFMAGKDAMRYIFELSNSPLESEFLTVMCLILNWMLFSAILLFILYPFFRNGKYTAIVKYYGLPVALVSTIFITVVTKGICGAEVYDAFSIRALFMGIELGIMLAYGTVVILETGLKVSREDAIGFVYIIFMLLATMPGYMFQALFGYSSYTVRVKSFELPHRIVLYFSFLIPFGLYLLLHKKDKETIRGILLYISLGTLLSFSDGFKFIDLTNVLHWPFHLCNTAMYIIPLCLIFRWKKIFYFTYFINVFGAFMAMIMPNFSDTANMFSDRTVIFYINHYIAFFMPILIVALKVYERPKLKEFKYSLVGFGAYFLLVLILNAWFSNYGEVDYFFINSDYIADKIGKWAEDLLKITWEFNISNLHFVFYPVYQLIFFGVYVGFSAAIWFLYEAAYSFVDTIYDILDRKKKIRADYLALQVARAQMGDVDMDNQEITLELRHFSKRYGTSKVYAVNDANLVVHGGDVFGFLGHNGAGKSTIIKSIVGIQPITSGSIFVCGVDVEKESVKAKMNIGYVPDHYALYEKLTGRQYINYIADLYGVSEEDRNKAIDKYVKIFELEGAFDNQMKTYSHGMKQKITIISALVHNPKLWILDEPLTGLDPTSIYQVKECMKEHAKAGNIVFFSSHLIDVVQSVCTRVAIIKKGHILDVQDVKDIEKKTTLEQYYLDQTSKDVEVTAVEENAPSDVIVPTKEKTKKTKKAKV